MSDAIALREAWKKKSLLRTVPALLLLVLSGCASPFVITDPRITCLTQAAFSPKGGSQELLVGHINTAKHEIRVAIYSLTNQSIVTSLLEAKNRGIDVSVKVDQLQSNQRLQIEAIDRLQTAGISVVISSLRRTLHDKFMAIDRHTVLTGSYNYTNTAEWSNEENLVALECPELARRYLDIWERIK